MKNTKPLKAIRSMAGNLTRAHSVKVPFVITALAAAILFTMSACASMQLVSLETDTVDGPKQVRQGQDINPRDITIYGIYKDESRKLVNVTSSNIIFDKHAIGPQTVRVRVSGQEASFQTQVMALRSLTVASPPTAALFKQGQDANPAWPGLEVRGEWDQMGSDRIDIASCGVSGYNKDQVGRQTVTVTFEGQSASFNVEVRGLASIRIVELPAKLTYDQGSTLDLTGLKVAGVWEGLPEEDLAIARNDITGFDASRLGNQLLTITKNGRTATFNVSVVAAATPVVTPPVTPTHTGTSGLAFREIDGSAYAVSAGTAKSGEVVIPAVYNGRPVTEIDPYAFANCADLTEIVIPDSVTSIGLNAFDGCTGLTRASIGSGVTRIGQAAFGYCTNLADVRFAGRIPAGGFNYRSLPGDLQSKYLAGGPGTYVRNQVWTGKEDFYWGDEWHLEPLFR